MRRVRRLGRCGWLLVAEGGTAGELRSAPGGRDAEATRGALPGREGRGLSRRRAMRALSRGYTDTWHQAGPRAGRWY